jgi:hypothetical protein
MSQSGHSCRRLRLSFSDFIFLSTNLPYLVMGMFAFACTKDGVQERGVRIYLTIVGCKLGFSSRSAIRGQLVVRSYFVSFPYVSARFYNHIGPFVSHPVHSFALDWGHLKHYTTGYPNRKRPNTSLQSIVSPVHQQASQDLQTPYGACAQPSLGSHCSSLLLANRST